MSIIAPALRRPWWPYAAAAGVVTALALVLVTASPHDAHPDVDAATSISVAAPGIEQARWRVDTYPSGSDGRPTKAQLALLTAQRPHVEALVRDVYDAMFLAPGKLGDVTEHSFDRGAARALEAANVGLPKGATDVEILVRRARVGIEVEAAGHAAARLWLKVAGVSGGGRFELRHRANLWLERSEGHWRVIAFDFKQKPLK